jgi:rhodanese-related sulfurtransferase
MKKTNLLLTLAMLLMVHVLSAQNAITFETFVTKLQAASPNPQLLDVRTPEEYKISHLKGAVNLSLTDEATVQKYIDKLDKNKPVFVYSINNGRSGVLVKKLQEQNFKEAYELPGGISKWIGEGKPLESSVSTGLTQTEYQQLITSQKLVLVDVQSKYCGGCKKLAPVVDSVAHQNTGQLKLVSIELFENKQLGNELNIESIPTLILYKDNKIVWRKNGKITREDIEAAIQTQLPQ